MMTKNSKPIIAISGCLIGEEIRYDGQHKRHPHVTSELAKDFQFESFCPEVSMGLGIPRPTIKLAVDPKEKDENNIQLIDSKDHGINHTKLSYKTFKTIDKNIHKASGIVLTKNSPSCGHDPVKVYSIKDGIPIGKSRGLWAQYLEDHYPLIPKIDSGRLFDKHLRDTFKTQVITYNEFVNNVKKPKEFVKFHEVHKFYLMQYGQKHMRELGIICAGVTSKNFKEKHQAYLEYMTLEAFKGRITPKKRFNVIQHMAGFFKDDLSKSDKKYLHENLDNFYNHKLDFETLVVLLGFLIQSYDATYLKSQKILKFYKP